MGTLKKINNLSLRKTLILYIVCFLLLGLAFSSLTINYADERQNSIWEKYSIPVPGERELGVGERTYYNGELVEDVRTIYIYPRVSSTILTDKEHAIVEFCDFLQTWSIFIYAAACVLGAVFLFYRNKIRIPLKLLNESTKEIEKNNLDFSLQYDKRDELGELCSSFEKMREQLQYNYRRMWRMIEEQKRVNAAFAHDLRTPLTVLRGYSDLLTRYVPEGKIDEEKLLSTIDMMSRQISRLESYTESMKQISSLEELEVNYESVKFTILEQTITESATILSDNAGMKVKVTTKGSLMEFLQLDTKIVFEVIENLLSNALRYAKTTVLVEMSLEDKQFIITIRDDGKGFATEDLNNAMKPYYKDKSEENANHFGLGLYISSVLCEKHGGKLVPMNGENGGGKVEAIFMTS